MRISVVECDVSRPIGRHLREVAMIHHDVIVAQSDCVVAEHLAAQLHSYFRNISVARDIDEVRHIIQRHGAHVVILDLDLADYGELRALTSEFHSVGFVCTHRVPDEEMWRETLLAGGIDCCANDDIHEIVRASRHVALAMRAAA